MVFVKCVAWETVKQQVTRTRNYNFSLSKSFGLQKYSCTKYTDWRTEDHAILKLKYHSQMSE